MTGTPRIGVNLLWIAPGRVGGSEEYLVRQLAGLDAAISPTLFAQPAFVDAHPLLTARFDTVAAPLRRDWRGARILAEHSWLRARTTDFDVVHHGGGTVPFGAGGAVVVTIHDLQYLTFPEHFSTGRRRYLAHMTPKAVGRAAAVTTPSAYVRDTVLRAFDVDADDVIVVPHGVPRVEQPSPEAIRAARRSHGLDDGPYLVYPAITHPHKGHRLLIEMMSHVDPDLRLVLLGGSGSVEAEVRRAIGESPVRDRIVRAGRVTATDRDALVAGADAMVFASEYEGFGAPLVESMGLGTPIVCGAHPAIREVVADAAVVVEDRTPTAWADGVVAARTDGASLRAAGRRRREDFTIEASGRALADAYRRAGARGGS
jgi:alpha-1,3-rhamnosyl/mannosyltransferase